MWKTIQFQPVSTTEECPFVLCGGNILNFTFALHCIGAESKDDEIPRTLWPPQDLCPSCSESMNEKIMWKKAAVLNFLKKYFSMDNIS